MQLLNCRFRNAIYCHNLFKTLHTKCIIYIYIIIQLKEIMCTYRKNGSLKTGSLRTLNHDILTTM